MAFNHSLINLLQTNAVSRYLTAGNRNSFVQDLQIALFDLGFGPELGWNRYQTDGYYSSGTIRAVMAFSRKNNMASNGLSVTPTLLIKMWERHETLDDLRILLTATSNNTLSSTYNLFSPGSYQNRSLQIIMNALGYYNVPLNNAIKDFGRKNGVQTDGFSLSRNLAIRIIQKVAAFFGSTVLSGYNLTPSTGGSTTTPGGGTTTPTNPGGGSTGGGGTTTPPPNTTPLTIRDEGSRLLVTDGRNSVRLVKKAPAGYAYWGSISIEQYINRNRSILSRLGVSDSAVNVMKSVSDNEGKLDAVNSYDRGFMSFGIYQWALSHGELAALLKKVKDKYPSTFRNLFGVHGLDVTSDTGPVVGTLTLHGNRIDIEREKEQFRDAEWAFRFWLAGQDPNVQAVEIEHALSRLLTFYWKADQGVNGFPLSQIITSEYGVALILDNHVNRPAFVKPCIEQAMQATGLQDPRRWGTTEEQRVLDAYLQIRVSYKHGYSGPMSEAMRRAAVTQRYLNSGIISNQRGSFIYEANAVASRSLSSDSSHFVKPPANYEEANYPNITPFGD
jgi:peptidoglycan hydrolase-like protein with peptidoglycan-binding domain